MSLDVPDKGDDTGDRVGESPTGRRRRSDAALNRASIMNSAREMLASNRDATMGQIAEAAGVGRGTVHRHFATREDLLDAVRRQGRDDLESDDEDRLRPAGELAQIAPALLSISDVLNKVPPFQLGEQIVAEALRLPGVSSAAVYVVDLDGASMQRLAGSGAFPDQIAVPLAVGPEIPREGLAAIRALFDDLLPGATVAPLHLRGRALGVLLAVGSAGDELRELAIEAAVALALATDYTDHIDTVRRTRPTSPAAEIQQNLLPPRIARVGGATLAGNVIPGYEIGGDWFDYAENPLGAWIGIADSAGTGPSAAGLGAVTLGAFRSLRRNSNDPAECLLAMHRVLRELRVPASASATVGLWNAPASAFTWISAGPQIPYRVTAEHALELLEGSHHPEIGTDAFEDEASQLVVNRARLAPGERLLLLSDGIVTLGEGSGARLEQLRAAVAKTHGQSAPATIRAIEDLVRETHPEVLEDDATLIVLSPSGPSPE